MEDIGGEPFEIEMRSERQARRRWFSHINICLSGPCVHHQDRRRPSAADGAQSSLRLARQHLP